MRNMERRRSEIVEGEHGVDRAVVDVAVCETFVLGEQRLPYCYMRKVLRETSS